VIPAVSPALVLAQASDPGLVDACGPKGEQSWLCSTVYRITGDTHAADVADALSKPIRIIVVLLGAWILVRITRVLTRRLVKHMSGGVERLASMKAVSFVDTGPMPQARRTQRAETIGAVVRSVVTIVIWSIAGLTILEILGINLGPLIAAAGIAGVALGFGAQSLVKDFLSGTFMLMEDQFGLGDVVDTGVPGPTGGTTVTGTVEGVSLRTTRLRDVDGVVWHVPNGTIQRIGNKSQQWSRAVVDVPVAFQADTAAATEVIRTVTDQVWHDPDYASIILAEPSVLGVESLAPGRVVIRVVARTRPQEQWRVERELRVKIKAALDEAGIALPSV
jgi:small conductance mechanosensitive channel